MAKQPINNGKVVERSYEDYRNNQYLVNRRYQRKLVWELEEKQAFIDSLANGYPVPLFLFAKCVYKGQDRSEIIDGMQRLNAVFSFIENDYLNSTPFVRQYDILFNKWGVLLCQKEYQTNDIRRNSREWL